MTQIAPLPPAAHLPSTALSNLRDLGGKRAGPGRRVRDGLLYRTALPAGLDAADMKRLGSLGIGSVVDLRGVAEAHAAPATLPSALVQRRRSIPIEPVAGPRIRAAQDSDTLTAAVVREIMLDGYRSYVGRHARSFAEFLRHVAGAEGAVLFHCSAGKDRTGFAAALTLSALGVGWGEVAEDFLRTNADWTPPAGVAAGVAPEVRGAWLGVEIAYLEAAFAALEAEHGGAEAFASAALGGESGLLALRAKYTE